MEKTVHCKCQSGCRDRRCVCLKNNEPCDEECDCIGCQNPLNGVDISNLSICAIQNIEAYKALTGKELKEEYELPCGCETAPLKNLMGDYSCHECGEI